MRRSSSIALVVVILVLTGALPAEAYIDPGNTSMLVQLAVGGIAAVAVLARRLWQGLVQRFITALRRSPSGPDSSRHRLDR